MTPGKSYHLCVPVKVALKKLKKGINFFNCSSNEAYKQLIHQQNIGKEFIAGCDNEDEEGRCAGHIKEVMQ